MCERRLDTGQAIIRHNGHVFVAPLKGDMKPMEYMPVYIDWLKNEVLAEKRFPLTSCSCNTPDIVNVEREIEIDGEQVRINANEWKN